MPENYEIFKDWIQTVGLLYLSLTVCSGVNKKTTSEKKGSENDQSTGNFRAFFLLFFHESEKKISVNQLIKNILALYIRVYNPKSYFTAPQAYSSNWVSNGISNGLFPQMKILNKVIP